MIGIIFRINIAKLVLKLMFNPNFFSTTNSIKIQVDDDRFMIVGCQMLAEKN